MAMKIVIVGGVAGGATAAARIRRLDENAEIIMFEKGEYISFANCGLPYYIGEIIKDKEMLVVQTPEKMKERYNIDIRINSEVLAIHPDKKTVDIYNRQEDKKYSETYDKLVLSPGAEPVKPKLPGIESSRVFTLRNIPDTYRIKDFIDTARPKRAVIAGAGFIGLEVAENLHLKGVKVTVVELADHVIGPLDYDMASIVHQHMKTKDVEFYLNDAVKAFHQEMPDTVITAELTSGRLLKADMVVMGIGVRPDSMLAVKAGLKTGVTGGDSHR